MGILGPTIRGEVGDLIRVHVKNIEVSQHTITLHAHGVLYQKGHEGTPYSDLTAGESECMRMQYSNPVL